MKEEQYDAHVMAYLTRKAEAELDAEGKVLDALKGMNSNSASRAIRSYAVLLDVDLH